MAEERTDLFEGLHKAVESAAPDLLRELLQAMVVTLMGAEVDALALRCREGRLRRRRCRRPIHHPSRGGSAPRRRSKLGGCREAPVHHLRGRGPAIEAAGRFAVVRSLGMVPSLAPGRYMVARS